MVGKDETTLALVRMAHSLLGHRLEGESATAGRLKMVCVDCGAAVATDPQTGETTWGPEFLQKCPGVLQRPGPSG